LVQSISGFLAFVLLPIWADAMGDEPLDNDGTSFALWMCAVLGGVSLFASVVVFFSMKKESNVYVEEQSDQQTVINSMRALAKATVPRLKGIQKWTLPLSFFFAIYGIKSQYHAPFGFTAFSNQIYVTKFKFDSSMASFLSGIISLIAGLLGPIMGPLSDKYGRRSLSLAFVTSLSMIGFGILAMSKGGSTSVWIASMLFAIQYGFGDTVAYISIRFIVGVSRAGIGYGVYGIIGNLIATVVPIIGGTLMDQNNGEDKVLWYFTGLMALGAASWVMVFILEGPRSLLELPANKVIETSDEDIKMAALTYVVGRTGTNKDTEEETPNTPAPTNTEAAPLVWSDHENVMDDNDVEAHA
jgi:nitrate/nitrite transporter NarK